MLGLEGNTAKIKQRINLLKRLGLKPKFFILPLTFSFVATFLEGVTLATLIPFVRGIITRDFQFVNKIPVVNKILEFFSPVIKFSDLNIFVFLLTVIFFSGILKCVSLYLSRIMVSYQVRKFSANLRSVIFDRYTKFGKMFFDRNSAGHLQNILSNFSVQISQQFIFINNTIFHILLFALYLGIMFFISWKITILIVLAMPVFDLVYRKLITKIRKSSENYAKSSNTLSAKLFNILSCITLVRLYNNEEDERKKFNSYNLKLQKSEFSIDKKTELLQPLQEMMFLILMMFLVVVISYMYVKQRTVEIASYMIYFYLLRRMQQSASCFNNLKVAFAVIQGPLTSILHILSDEDKFFIPQGNKHFEGLKEKIEFSHLNFSYFKERQILHDISFSINKGKIAAIVGSTGSGKTTLVNLLMRFYDSPHGSIFIDGVDIRSFTTKSLLEHFVYVSQETALFNDTLRNNIVYGLKISPNDKAIMEVIKKARLSDFISSLPEGIDAYIGDRGVKLSGGEKQRVAIARAMLKGAEILVFDEATSSLDSKTEGLIQEAIDEVVKDKTVIVIAHRLSTVKNADKIVVIEQGRFIEEGGLEQLIEKHGKFYEYWQKQKFY
jgi:subfamily B ATP-binding cassette protein MsbA